MTPKRAGYKIYRPLCFFLSNEKICPLRISPTPILMNKTTKYVLIAVIVIGLAVWGIISFRPKKNNDIPAGPMPGGYKRGQTPLAHFFIFVSLCIKCAVSGPG